jgi:N-acetylmuramoyl-L-alanine amidase
MKLCYIIPSFQDDNLDVHKVPESKTMLSLANGIAAKLVGANFKVMVSKKRTLNDAIREANRLGATLVLHLHSNAGANGTGTEVFYDPRKPETKVLATRMADSISRALSIKNRGAKDGRAAGYLAIKGAHIKKVNSILIESFFHNNEQDVYKSQIHWKSLINEIAWQLKVYFS